jgi:AraC-like DNA-binding protein
MSVPSQNGPNVVVREDWLIEICSRLQHALCAAAIDRSEPHALSGAFSKLPPPANRLEQLILEGLLLEMTFGAPARGVTDLVARARMLSLAFPRTPALSIAQRAADEICRTYQRPLRISVLTDMLASDETTLRKQFLSEYGTGLRDYHLRARTAAALRMIANDQVKVTVVAAAVGYVNDRNFYRNVRRLTGCTPGELRERTPAQLLELADGMLPKRRVVRLPHNAESKIPIRYPAA